MFGSKRKKETPDAAGVQAAPQRSTSSGGYVSSELPTFHGRQGKVVVCTSDSSGRIVKSFKKR